MAYEMLEQQCPIVGSAEYLTIQCICNGFL